MISETGVKDISEENEQRSTEIQSQVEISKERNDDDQSSIRFHDNNEKLPQSRFKLISEAEMKKRLTNERQSDETHDKSIEKFRDEHSNLTSQVPMEESLIYDRRSDEVYDKSREKLRDEHSNVPSRISIGKSSVYDRQSDETYDKSTGKLREQHSNIPSEISIRKSSIYDRQSDESYKKSTGKLPDEHSNLPSQMSTGKSSIYDRQSDETYDEIPGKLREEHSNLPSQMVIGKSSIHDQQSEETYKKSTDKLREEHSNLPSQMSMEKSSMYDRQSDDDKSSRRLRDSHSNLTSQLSLKKSTPENSRSRETYDDRSGKLRDSYSNLINTPDRSKRSIHDPRSSEIYDDRSGKLRDSYSNLIDAPDRSKRSLHDPRSPEIYDDRSGQLRDSHSNLSSPLDTRTISMEPQKLDEIDDTNNLISRLSIRRSVDGQSEIPDDKNLGVLSDSLKLSSTYDTSSRILLESTSKSSSEKKINSSDLTSDTQSTIFHEIESSLSSYPSPIRSTRSVRGTSTSLKSQRSIILEETESAMRIKSEASGIIVWKSEETDPRESEEIEKDINLIDSTIKEKPPDSWDSKKSSKRSILPETISHDSRISFQDQPILESVKSPVESEPSIKAEEIVSESPKRGSKISEFSHQDSRVLSQPSSRSGLRKSAEDFRGSKHSIEEFNSEISQGSKLASRTSSRFGFEKSAADFRGSKLRTEKFSSEISPGLKTRSVSKVSIVSRKSEIIPRSAPKLMEGLEKIDTDSAESYTDYLAAERSEYPEEVDEVEPTKLESEDLDESEDESPFGGDEKQSEEYSDESEMKAFATSSRISRTKPISRNKIDAVDEVSKEKIGETTRVLSQGGRQSSFDERYSSEALRSREFTYETAPWSSKGNIIQRKSRSQSDDNSKTGEVSDAYLKKTSGRLARESSSPGQ